MPSAAVAAALDRMKTKAGVVDPPRPSPPLPSAEDYGTEQLLEDLRADRCPVHGCDLATPTRWLMCRGHWRLVHADLKREVNEAVGAVVALGRRYDSASGQRQADLADRYLAAEDRMRDCQLRAVIIASERAGARPS